MLAELFIDGYLEGCLSQGLRWPEGTIASDLETASCRGHSCRNHHGSDALLEKARILYASISAPADAVGANSLILAIRQYRTDPGVGAWLNLLMKGRVKGQLVSKRGM